MNLSFMQNELVLALGWTLIHSLWQGLLLTIITGAILMVTRSSDARKRYDLLTGLFFIFLAVVGITFIREVYVAFSHHGSSAYNLSLRKPLSLAVKSIIPFTDAQIIVNKNWPERLKDYFTEHASLIVTIWFVVFMARFIKLVADLAYIQRLKSYRTSEPSVEWKEKLNELVQKLGIAKYVQMLESGVVKVPVVMGILKPVILLPAGLLSKLPPDEIEAILLHELAHIRRSDYFVNLVQSFAETLFFFNPALMWLSSLIREERESCCDDIAISVTNNKVKFIDALISFQELDLTKPSFAMGFPGKKNQLLNRVKRIINKRNKTMNTTEKSILTLSIAILIMFSFVAAKNTPLAKLTKRISSSSTEKIDNAAGRNNTQPLLTTTVQQREKAETIGLLGQYQQVTHDTVPAKEVALPPVPPMPPATSREDSFHFEKYSTDVSNDGNVTKLTITVVTKQGVEYKLSKINEKIIEFAINGTVIDNSRIPEYSTIIEGVQAPYYKKQHNMRERSERETVAHELDVIRTKLSELKKEENVRPKMVYLNNKWQMVGDTLKNKYLDKQLELQQKLSDLDNRIILEDVQKQDNEMKKQKLINLKADMKELNVKMSSIDANIQRLKTGGDDLKVSADYKKSDLIYKDAKTNDGSKLTMRTSFDMKKDNMIELRRKSELLRHELAVNENKMAELRKKEAVRQRSERDAVSYREQATVIRNIAADLERNNVSIDLAKGWFALDEKRLIVNGQTMPADMHRKFKVKYVKSKGGYFYGPVQLQGRGVFMEYQDLNR